MRIVIGGTGTDMEEVWKDIEGYEGYYQVSNLGRVKGIKIINQYKKERLLSQYLNNKGRGYYKVWLYKDKKRKMHYVHRLVAKAFLPNPNNYPDINHKDENSRNNQVDNLEWCNESYNLSYGTVQSRRRMAFLRKKLKVFKI